ncbi:MAG: choice-of-anchor J domain-containing protein [Clostridia bacterium]|nr:choice-of-anchor J domain-containing protein [Clostridia bacterium]
MTKKLISLLVAALMVLAVVPLGAMARVSVGEAKTELMLADRHGGARRLNSLRANEAPAVKDDVVLTDLLLEENWDGDSLNNPNWWMYNADGNTFTYNDSTNYSNWVWSTVGEDYAYSGTGAMMSYSYIGSTARDQDNWLVTPDLTIPAAGYYLSYYARSANESFLDHLQIMIGESGVAYDDSTITPSEWVSAVDLYEVPASYSQMLVDLSAYAGKTIAIAFRHVDYDEVAVILDDVAVGLGDSSSIVADTGVTVSAGTLALTLTNSSVLTATVAPENTTFPGVTWSSSDTSVAVVNSVGGVLAVGVGTATITATSHSGFTASCEVTVTEGEESFEDDLIAYGIYDLNTQTENTWYTMDRFGTAVVDAAGDTTFYASEYDGMDGKLYAYEEVEGSDSTYTYNFLSFDIANSYAKTVIATGLSTMPEWMAYDFDNDVMYGGFYYQDADEKIHFDIAEVDLTTGLEGEVLVDTYNAAYDENDTWGLVPRLVTYVGSGIFAAASSDYIFLLAPNYEGEELAVGFLGDDQATVSAQVGSMTQYAQKLWYNPFDGMLYWAAIFGNTCTMVVTDMDTGVSAATGVTGLAGETNGMQTTALFVPYTLQTTVTYTVTFVDGLTNEVIKTEVVEEGTAATAPEPPVHEGYTFTGWDADFSSVTSDMKVVALYEQNPVGLLGDVNCDGVVDMGDISALSAYLLGMGQLSAEGLANADASLNGSVDSSDLSAIFALI